MAEKIDFASVGYALGILSIIFAFTTTYSLGGLVTGIVGLVQSNKAKSKKAKKLNILGIVLSIIFFILSMVVIYTTGGFSSIIPAA